MAGRLIPEAGSIEALDDGHCRSVSAPDSRDRGGGERAARMSEWRPSLVR
jgi:hypothetical protein